MESFRALFGCVKGSGGSTVDSPPGHPGLSRLLAARVGCDGHSLSSPKPSPARKIDHVVSCCFQFKSWPRAGRMSAMTYLAADDRYASMTYRRAGRSGV
ncbi:hypothetical protein ACWGB8_03735, partial [Kitasatospora sp. NPDC054939]